MQDLLYAQDGSLYVVGPTNLRVSYATGIRGIARWDGGGWHDVGGGIDGDVLTLVQGPDGALYAGGLFSEAGNVRVSNFARWDGSAWSSLGASVGGEVRAIAVTDDGTIYIGGSFRRVGTVEAEGLAAWDGQRWTGFGTGIGTHVEALVTDGQRVYAGGQFALGGSRRSSAAVVEVRTGRLAPLVEGEGRGHVAALVLSPEGRLFVGGSGGLRLGSTEVGSVGYWEAGQWHGLGLEDETGIVVQDIAFGSLNTVFAVGETDGIQSRVFAHRANSWSALGTGPNGDVWAVEIGPNGTPVIGGTFSAGGTGFRGRVTEEDGVDVTNVARWTGSKWTDLWIGLDGEVTDFTFDESGNLYAVGSFQNGDDMPMSDVARWGYNPRYWSRVGEAFPLVGTTRGGSHPSSVAWSSDGLFIAGGFTEVDGVFASSIARWDGRAWGLVGEGIAAGCVEEGPDGRVYLAARFAEDHSSAGRWRHAVYRNGDWQVLPGEHYDMPCPFGVDARGRVHSEVPRDLVGDLEDMANTPDGNLIAVGNGGAARWNGTAWSELEIPFNNESIREASVAVDEDGTIFISAVRSPLFGEELEAGAYIYQFYPGDGAWTTIYFNERGRTPGLMRVGRHGWLYVTGGDGFGVAARGLAMWDGRVWSPVGSN